MEKLGRKPQKLYNVRTAIIQGKNILAQRNNAYEIDEVAMSIWERCDGNHTVENIVEALTKEYSVEYKQALADCEEFVNDLIAKGLLEWA